VREEEVRVGAVEDHDADLHIIAGLVDERDE